MTARMKAVAGLEYVYEALGVIARGTVRPMIKAFPKEPRNVTASRRSRSIATRTAASGSTVNTLGMNRASDGGRCFGPLNEQCIDVAGVDYLTITVRDLERSAGFYRRVFGCDVVDQDDGGHGILMKSCGRLYLSIHEWRGSLAADAWPPSRWSFVVADLDRVRESVWNLGVATADGTEAPRRVYPWRPERSFVIRDPDGNEIELVELDR